MVPIYLCPLARPRWQLLAVRALECLLSWGAYLGFPAHVSESVSFFSWKMIWEMGDGEIREYVFSSRVSDPWTSTDETLALANSHILREPCGVSPTYTVFGMPGTLESWQNL